MSNFGPDNGVTVDHTRILCEPTTVGDCSQGLGKSSIYLIASVKSTNQIDRHRISAHDVSTANKRSANAYELPANATTDISGQRASDDNEA
jgi:hypothetical protein